MVGILQSQRHESRDESARAHLHTHKYWLLEVSPMEDRHPVQTYTDAESGVGLSFVALLASSGETDSCPQSIYFGISFGAQLEFQQY